MELLRAGFGQTALDINDLSGWFIVNDDNIYVELPNHTSWLFSWSKVRGCELFFTNAGVPGEKPQVTSDKLPDSPSKFPCIQL